MPFKRLCCYIQEIALLIVTCFLLAGCDFLESTDSTGPSADDDKDWIGTWAVDSIDGESLESTFEEEEANVSIITNHWTFNKEGRVEGKIQIKWEGEGIKIIEINESTVGTYSLNDAIYARTLEITTEETYNEGEGKTRTEVETTTEVDTGTWSRTGNILTLNSDNKKITVFKKKV